MIHPDTEVRFISNEIGYGVVATKFIPKGTRRKMVHPDDLEHYHEQWDKKLQAAFKYLPKVEQPLLRLLPEDIKEKATYIAEGKQQMDSILNIYYKEK